MGIFDEFKRLAHPYEDEEEDDEFGNQFYSGNKYTDFNRNRPNGGKR